VKVAAAPGANETVVGAALAGAEISTVNPFTMVTVNADPLEENMARVG
jgi:hypothetical protein